MIPYINFVNYSKDYNWFLELIRPQPSLFTKAINRNIYKTWNGEALINFKWNAYGKYYYAMIWILFMILLLLQQFLSNISMKKLDNNFLLLQLYLDLFI